MMVYADTYRDLTPSDHERAKDAERVILEDFSEIQIKFLQLGEKLSRFKKDKMYLALGFATFELWAESPQLKIGRTTARNLVRIYEEALPILADHDAMHLLPPYTTLADMLPILHDADGEQKFIDAAYVVQGLSTRDAKEAIKEVRGIAPSPRDPQPAMFKLRYRIVDDMVLAEVWCSVNTEYYQCTTQPLRIKLRDWPRYQALYKGYVEEL